MQMRLVLWHSSKAALSCWPRRHLGITPRHFFHLQFRGTSAATCPCNVFGYCLHSNCNCIHWHEPETLIREARQHQYASSWRRQGPKQQEQAEKAEMQASHGWVVFAAILFCHKMNANVSDMICPQTKFDHDNQEDAWPSSCETFRKVWSCPKKLLKTVYCMDIVQVDSNLNHILPLLCLATTWRSFYMSKLLLDCRANIWRIGIATNRCWAMFECHL